MQKPSAKVDGITISFFYLETSGSQQKQKQEKQNKGYKKCLTRCGASERTRHHGEASVK